MSREDYTAVALGGHLPNLTSHAISVSLPTWRDNVGYEEGEKRVANAMKNGYPRFFIHLSIQKLMSVCEQKFGNKDERCMLFPSRQTAEYCRLFMLDQGPKQNYTPKLGVRLVRYLIARDSVSSDSEGSIDLYIVLFHADAASLAKQFWQHTGMGISSRLADHCLSLLSLNDTTNGTSEPASPKTFASRGTPFKPSNNRHYNRSAAKPPHIASTTPNGSGSGGHSASASTSSSSDEHINVEHDTYLEERYGRNLPLSSADGAKRALRRRIAGVLVKDDASSYRQAGDTDVAIGPSSRGVKELSEDDVFLFSTGMTAIWNAHNLAREAMREAKSVCFGFPYIDTLKILEKWGPGCHFLGHGLDSDIDELERILQSEPILALFTEFPSNPLLRSADLPRLRRLADQHGFLIVVDDSIGNFANVDVLPYADMVVSSLTKIFSGDANVMGGSLVLNPLGQHYPLLKAKMTSIYQDNYFDQDAIYLERNSRDFKRRARAIDSNTEAVCDFLYSRSLAVSSSTTTSPTSHTPSIKTVYYPKFTTTHHYRRCRYQGDDSPTLNTNEAAAGYGGLFSLSFTSLAAATSFFDTLQCSKGPSLGTNFTLASPYTILAHYPELDWAESWGVDRNLVRISIGVEKVDELLRIMLEALDAADRAGART